LQFLALSGRIGGQRSASTALKSFSEKFEWANFKPPFSFLGDSNRTDVQRQKGRIRRSDQNTSSEQESQEAAEKIDEEEECGWHRGFEAAEVVVGCLLCLSLVSLARSAISWIIVHGLKKELPDSMLFPAWEGMHFLTNF